MLLEKGKKGKKEKSTIESTRTAISSQNGSERAGGDDGPMMVDYSKTRARARVPTSEMEGLIYYSVSRFVARGVVRLSLGTRAKLLTSLINVRRVYVSRVVERGDDRQFPCTIGPDDQKQRLNRNK